MRTLDAHLKNHLSDLVMLKRFRKIGFLLSVAAVVFTAICLPLHYHANEAAAPDSAHCAVCRFSKEARSTSITAASVPSANWQAACLVALPALSYIGAEIIFASSPRAPPTA